MAKARGGRGGPLVLRVTGGWQSATGDAAGAIKALGRPGGEHWINGIKLKASVLVRLLGAFDYKQVRLEGYVRGACTS